jgi:putative oxidoreductase
MKLFGGFHDDRTSFGLLVLRVVAGYALILHGWPKVGRGFNQWMGTDSPIPGWLQSLAVLSEVGGGLALILGFLTPVASFGILCTMAYATYTHVSKGQPFVANTGGHYEKALLFFSIALLMLLAGPGKFSVDRFIFGRRRTEPAESSA